MPETVVLFTTELRPGGAERIVCELAAGLDRGLYSPRVAALDGRGEYADRLRSAGVPVHDLGARHAWQLPRAVAGLRQLLAEQNAALLHAHLHHATIVGRLATRRAGVACLATCHIVERRFRPWRYWLDALTAGWGAAEICVSQAVAAHQRRRTGLPAEYFPVIPNGLDLARFAGRPDRAAARQALNLPPDRPLVGALGRFDRQKGFDLLLTAWAQSSLRESDAGLVLAGYGPQESELRELATRLNLPVYWAGYQAEAARFLPALDLCVCPSRWEGFGLVALEALACGVPLVASRVDSLPEIVRDGLDGILVEPEDPSALALGVAGLLAAPAERRRLAEAGPVRAQAFSAAAMITAHERLYAQTIEAANRS